MVEQAYCTYKVHLNCFWKHTCKSYKHKIMRKHVFISCLFWFWLLYNQVDFFVFSSALCCLSFGCFCFGNFAIWFLFLFALLNSVPTICSNTRRLQHTLNFTSYCNKKLANCCTTKEIIYIYISTFRLQQYRNSCSSPLISLCSPQPQFYKGGSCTVP